jgi:hemolysin activation/secretion protein
MIRRPILVFLALLVCQWPLHAQQPPTPDPGALQKKSEDTFQYYDLQKKLDELQRQKAAEDAKKNAKSAAGPSADSGESFLLRHLVISPSELLSSQELAAISAKYENRQISLADLNQLIDDINHLYQTKGDVTAKAVLPPQQVTNGEVRVTLIEGRVGKVSVANKTRTRESYILSCVHLNPGELIRIDQLQQSITFLNSTSDLKVKAVLQPGASFGTSDVELQVEEPPKQSSMLFFDNAGHDGVGNQRVGLVQRYSSLFGLSDPFTTGIYGASGTLDYFTSYEIPVGSWGSRLGANFDDSHIHIGSGPTQKFGVSGHSTTSSLKFTQAMIETSTTRLSTAFSADYITSLLRSQNTPLTDTLVRTADFTVNLEIFDHAGLWSVSPTFSGGFHNLGGSRDFLKFSGSILRMQNLSGGMTGLLRITGQTNAFNYLPTVEQFQIGGVATVRGYPEGRQIGDRGYTGTLELQFPSMFHTELAPTSPVRNRFREVVFFDTGAVFDSYRSAGRPPGDKRYLTSVGSGFILSLSRYFSGRFDVGVPLRTTKGISSVGYHFYLQSTPDLGVLMKKFGQGAWSMLQ